MTAIQDKSEEFSQKYRYSGGFYKLEEFKNLFIFFQLLSRRNALHERAMYRRAQLADSFHLQQFFRDSDELKSWVNEKMKTATDEAYKVNTKANVRVILRQYQA